MNRARTQHLIAVICASVPTIPIAAVGTSEALGICWSWLLFLWVPLALNYFLSAIFGSDNDGI